MTIVKDDNKLKNIIRETFDRGEMYIDDSWTYSVLRVVECRPYYESYIVCIGNYKIQQLMNSIMEYKLKMNKFGIKDINDDRKCKNMIQEQIRKDFASFEESYSYISITIPFGNTMYFLYYHHRRTGNCYVNTQRLDAKTEKLINTIGEYEWNEWND